MGWLAYLIILAIQGLIFGALARLALPGRDPMSIPMTIGLGIAGSFIGGLLVYLISGGGAPRGGFFALLVRPGGLLPLPRPPRRGGGLSPPAPPPPPPGAAPLPRAA